MSEAPQFEIITGSLPTHKNIMIYGGPGIGKTTLASKAKRSIIIDLERGSKYMDVARVEVSTWPELLKVVPWIGVQQDFDTVIFDSYTRIEKMMIDALCAENGWPNIEKPGYGKGYEYLKQYAQKFLSGLEYLNRKGKNTITIAHARIKTFTDPTSEAYDRYEPDAHKNSLPYLVSFYDAIFFYRWKTIVREAEKGSRYLAKGSGDRELFAEEKPAFIAKNRLGLPESVINPEGEFINGIL